MSEDKKERRYTVPRTHNAEALARAKKLIRDAGLRFFQDPIIGGHSLKICTDWYNPIPDEELPKGLKAQLTELASRTKQFRFYTRMDRDEKRYQPGLFITRYYFAPMTVQ